MTSSFSSSCFFFFFLFFFPGLVLAQQFYYTSSTTEDCKNRHPENAGYVCTSSQQATCETLAYYRILATGSFTTLSSIAVDLFNTTESDIKQASSLSSSQIYAQQGIYIPISCSCYGTHSSYNVTYIIRPGDTFWKLANATYEGLTTCQAIQDANPTLVVTNLQISQRVVFPIRCACPSSSEASQGFTTLVTYPVADGDDVNGVVARFGIELDAFVAVNSLSNASAPLFPATTVLLPFREKPTVPPNATSSSSGGATSSSSSSSSPASKRGTYIAIIIAIVIVIVLVALLAALLLWRRSRNTKKRKDQPFMPIATSIPSPSPPLLKPQVMKSKPDDLYLGMGDLMNSGHKIITYTLDDIKRATQDFSTLIEGTTVYRGDIKGNSVAIKRFTRNISKELEILCKVHHVNLVTLLGSCIASPEQSYLVYEYAENGSLSDCLHGQGIDYSISSNSQSSSTLLWTTRLQVALDVATALEYIHDHTNPSYVHKDIKSSNILLDAKFRGKVANFGLAKSTLDSEDQVTIHIMGTRGYMAPEYVSLGVVSPKTDVFALGVILLEILSGEQAVLRDGVSNERFLYQVIGPLLDDDDDDEGLNSKERLKKWMDPRLQNAYPLDCAYSVACLAKLCVAEKPSERPNAREVGYTLGKLLTLSIEWEPSTVSDYRPDHLEAR